jgi:hypothetical protein
MSIIAHSLMTQNDANLSRNRQGMGIATVALIDSTVNVTTRQRDSAPIASDVAMAPDNREEVTGVRLLSKPTAPDNRIIGSNPCTTDESPRLTRHGHLAAITGNIAATTG